MHDSSSWRIIGWRLRDTLSGPVRLRCKNWGENPDHRANNWIGCGRSRACFQYISALRRYCRRNYADGRTTFELKKPPRSFPLQWQTSWYKMLSRSVWTEKSSAMLCQVSYHVLKIQSMTLKDAVSAASRKMFLKCLKTWQKFVESDVSCRHEIHWQTAKHLFFEGLNILTFKCK